MKDALGHGSNTRGGSYPNIDKNLRGPGKHVGYGDGAWRINKSEGQYHAYQQSGTGYVRGKTLGDISNQLAARSMASGPKSDQVPIHDAWSSTPGGDRADAGPVTDHSANGGINDRGSSDLAARRAASLERLE